MRPAMPGLNTEGLIGIRHFLERLYYRNPLFIAFQRLEGRSLRNRRIEETNHIKGTNRTEETRKRFLLATFSSID